MRNIKFQADADLKQAIVSRAIRRQPSIDFQSGTKADLEGIKDPEVLTMSAQNDRVLVTHDRKTMPLEFGRFIMTQDSPGVLVISQRVPINEAIEAIILIWEASSKEEWTNQIMTFPF